MITLADLRRLALSLLLTVALAACGDGSDAPPPAADPLVAGPYPVGVTRVELFDATQGRTQLTEVWYPAAESARGQEPAPAESYLPEGQEALAANATIPLVGVRNAELAGDAPFPLIAFSHGNGGIRFQNVFQCEHLASHGYVVVAPDHQFNTVFDIDQSRQAEVAIARPRDIRFLLDSFADFSDDAGSPFEGWVDTATGFGVTGHSFGAYTALAAANQDDRIVAVMPLTYGVPVSDTYAAATFLMLGTEDQTIFLEGNANIRATYEQVPRPRFIAEIVDAGHYSFTFACQVGLAGPWDFDGCGDSTRLGDGSPLTFIDDMRVWDIVNGYSAAFFGRYIKGIEEYDTTLATNLDPAVTLYTAEP
jgi:dienelactone hydrolase